MEQTQTITIRNQVGATSLIAGTCIGAGILGLPVETAAVGFTPSLILYAICWFFMSWTGLIFVDIFDKVRHCTNFTPLARLSFGPLGAAFTSIVYAGLFLTLMAVYMRGGGELIALCLSPSPPLWVATTAFVMLLTPLILMGMRAIGPVNALLLCVMIAAYFLFVAVCFPHIDIQLLQRTDWKNMGFAFPIILTAFGFQGSVPTLLKQLNYDKGAAKRAILLGSLLAFAVYMLWQALILGTIPYSGTTGLQAALLNDQTAISPLQMSVGSAWIYPLGRLFGVCALASSFLGVGISLVDFLAEDRSLRWRNVSCLAVIAIPYLLAIQDVPIFYRALRYGGGLGCLLLLVVLPTAVLQRSLKGSSKRIVYPLWAFIGLATYFEMAHLF